jgi:low affinity Fe/Cu permease
MMPSFVPITLAIDTAAPRLQLALLMADGQGWFTSFAKHAAHGAGKPVAFVLAGIVIVGWLATGPLFGYEDRWMWFIHTVTSIATFLMVFLLQNSENRNTEAMQIKLDEIIRSLDKSHKAVLDLEELDESELERIQAKYEELVR